MIEWKYTGDHPLRVVTLCSGYDSQLMAIRNLGIPYECVGWSEIDKYAIKGEGYLIRTDRVKDPRTVKYYASYSLV